MDKAVIDYRKIAEAVDYYVGLGYKYKEVLKEIAKKKINQKEIADTLNWPKSTVASCLKRMLKFKFIEKYIPNNLKIAKYYILTKKGQEVYNEIVPFDS